MNDGIEQRAIELLRQMREGIDEQMKRLAAATDVIAAAPEGEAGNHLEGMLRARTDYFQSVNAYQRVVAYARQGTLSTDRYMGKLAQLEARK